MSSPLEISSIKKIQVKPVAWRLVEHLDHTFTLHFTYLQPTLNEWQEVRIRGGMIKFYKSTTAAISDIRKVMSDAVIYTQFLGDLC
jgi:hypothetical protein